MQSTASKPNTYTADWIGLEACVGEIRHHYDNLSSKAHQSLSEVDYGYLGGFFSELGEHVHALVRESKSLKIIVDDFGKHEVVENEVDRSYLESDPERAVTSLISAIEWLRGAPIVGIRQSIDAIGICIDEVARWF